MCTVKQRLVVIAAILTAAATAACSMGGAIFTEEELDAMYSISVSSDGIPLAAGARVSASTPLDISVTGMDGAPEAATLEVQLAYPDGAEAAALAFASPGAAATGAKTINSFETDVPPFTVPEGLPDSYYTLTARIKNAQGAILSKFSTAVLMYEGEFPEPRLTAYPGIVTAGGVSLLRLEGDYPDGIDPWIRWTVDGSVRAVGFMSDRADRLAWQAPKASGVYIAKVELYPFQPPSGYPIAPLAKADIRLPLSGGLAPADSFAASVTWSRLTFDGDFADKGARARSAEPVAIGAPYLETYSSGFGYLLGAGVGVSSASSLVPARASDGRLEPFSAVFTLSPAQTSADAGSGTLFSVAGYDGDAGFVIGVSDGVPFIASGDATTSATEALPAGVSRLAVYVEQSENGAFIQFYIDDRPAGDGILNAGLFASRPGACVIAGESGYAAVYDDMRIIAGPYPAFRLAESQPEAKGSALLAASGFEGGQLGAELETEGQSVGLSHGRLVLGPDARLLVGAGGQPDQGSSLSFRLLEGRAKASLQLESSVSLIVDSDGAIWLDDQDTNLRLSPSGTPDGLFSVSIEPTKEGLRVYGLDDSPMIIKDSTPAKDARWSIYTADGKPLAITDVSLSIFTAPLAATRSGTRRAEESADAPSRSAPAIASPAPAESPSRSTQSGNGIAALGL